MLDLFDTHTHLYFPEFTTSEPDTRDSAVRRAIDAGVRRMMMPNVDHESARPLMQLAARFPENIMTAAGLHPTEVDDSWRHRLSEILEVMHDYKAIGEAGLDLHWDSTHLDQQMQAFDYQLSLAENKGLVTIVHTRDALEPTIEVLKSHPDARCIIHSFTGTPADVDRLRSVGDYHFGINGIVTFKNGRLEATVQEITPERLLLETDAPYLAPHPHRGTRNESSYIPLIAARCAEILQMPIADLAAATTANAERLFA